MADADCFVAKKTKNWCVAKTEKTTTRHSISRARIPSMHMVQIHNEPYLQVFIFCCRLKILFVCEHDDMANGVRDAWRTAFRSSYLGAVPNYCSAATAVCMQSWLLRIQQLFERDYSRGGNNEITPHFLAARDHKEEALAALPAERKILVVTEYFESPRLLFFFVVELSIENMMRGKQ